MELHAYIDSIKPRSLQSLHHLTIWSNNLDDYPPTRRPRLVLLWTTTTLAVD